MLPVLQRPVFAGDFKYIVTGVVISNTGNGFSAEFRTRAVWMVIWGVYLLATIIIVPLIQMMKRERKQSKTM